MKVSTSAEGRGRLTPLGILLQTDEIVGWRSLYIYQLMVGGGLSMYLSGRLLLFLSTFPFHFVRELQ